MMKAYKISFISIFLLFFTSCSFFEKKKEEKILQEYNNTPVSYIPKTLFPVYGNSQSKIKVDIFFDPWCNPCRVFNKNVIYPILADSHYKNKVSINYHLFSLLELYENDKEASLLYLEMAKRNLFTEFKKQVEQQKIKNYSQMLELAESLAKVKLRLDLLERNNLDDYNNENQVSRINLRLMATPSIFVDNKKISIPSLDNLKSLIDYIEKLH